MTMTTQSDAASGTRLPRGRPTKNAAMALRKDILKAAAKLFFDTGFSASMESIAAEARVSKRTLYAHYPSKISLFDATQTWLQGNLAKPATTIPVEASLRDALIHFCDQLHQLYVRPKMVALWKIVNQESARFPELASAYHQSFLDNIVTPLEQFLERRVGQELLAVNVNVLATNICAIAIAQLTRVHLPKSRVNHEDYAQFMAIAIDQLLSGVSSKTI